MRVPSAATHRPMTDRSPTSHTDARRSGDALTGAAGQPVDRLAVLRLSDAAQLADLLRREPVNPVDGSDAAMDGLLEQALQARTGLNRRVFALVRPDDPSRVRTVVWVALTHGVPTSLTRITEPPGRSEDAGPLDTAVFWSIWNDDTGVAGQGRGGDLILGAAEQLREELPTLTTFVTLSPAPGFRHHLEQSDPDAPERPASISADAARYLTTLDASGSPIDPVARFHLRNGARLWRVVPDADLSERGMTRSFGLLVNYRYAPEDLAANRAQLADGTPALGEQVAALLA